jgi:hypothetical protein
MRNIFKFHFKNTTKKFLHRSLEYQHSDTQFNDTQHTESQNNNTQYNGLICDI